MPDDRLNAFNTSEWPCPECETPAKEPCHYANGNAMTDMHRKRHRNHDGRVKVQFDSGSGPRRCSMSSFMGGPWHCGSGACPKDENCGARLRNELEARLLIQERESWEHAWLLTANRWLRLKQ